MDTELIKNLVIKMIKPKLCLNKIIKQKFEFFSNFILFKKNL